MAISDLADREGNEPAIARAWLAAVALAERVFVPRELILRADGRVSYVRLSSRVQKLAAAAACVLAAWGAYASVSYLVHRDTLAAKDGTIASQSSAYRDLEREFSRSLSEQMQLEAEISGLSRSLSREVAVSGGLSRERTALERRVQDLEDRLGQLRRAHKGVIERFSQLAAIRADAVESTIAATGLDAERLVTSIESVTLGRGGPLVPVRAAVADPDHGTALAAALADLNEQWSRLFALQEARRILPLTAPLAQFWVSSGYGERKDPLTGETSYHAGVDLVAPLGTAIRATAPGQVLFAGERKRYGRVVEIDHGHGITTRYAHLGKISVESGQWIGRGQKIGTLGNSGRSTGPHLHYEVRSGERDLNPMKFLDAGTQAIEG